MVPPRARDNASRRVGYEAAQASRRQPAKSGRTLSSLRQEPTWGDVAALIDIVTALEPANTVTLVSAFGLPLRGPRHLQICRNSCAHKHSENLQAIRQIGIYYLNADLEHPGDLAWKTEASSLVIGYFRWVEDLLVMADVATK